MADSTMSLLALLLGQQQAQSAQQQGLGPATGGLSGLAGDVTGKMLKGSGFLGGKYFSA